MLSTSVGCTEVAGKDKLKQGAREERSERETERERERGERERERERGEERRERENKLKYKTFLYLNDYNMNAYHHQITCITFNQERTGNHR